MPGLIAASTPLVGRFGTYLGARVTIELSSRVRIGDLRGGRFGEIMLITTDGGRQKAAIYSTVGLNECPASAWRALDPAKLAADFGAQAAYLNGPSYWTADELAVDAIGEPVNFGDLQARLVGEIFVSAATDFAEGAMPLYHHDLVVSQQTEWVFSASRPLHKLLSPAGDFYYMVAYSRTIDASLSGGSLTALGPRLHLPAGWRYRVGSPVKDLVMRPADGQTRVRQDELGNTYVQLANGFAAVGESRRREDPFADAVKAAFRALLGRRSQAPRAFLRSADGGADTC